MTQPSVFEKYKPLHSANELKPLKINFQLFRKLKLNNPAVILHLKDAPGGSRGWSINHLDRKSASKTLPFVPSDIQTSGKTILSLSGWGNLNFLGLVIFFSPKSHLPENSKMLKMEENRICSLWKLFCNLRNVARLFPSTLYFLHFKETLQVLFKFNIFRGVVFNIQLGASPKNTHRGYLSCFWHRINVLD